MGISIRLSNLEALGVLLGLVFFVLGTAVFSYVAESQVGAIFAVLLAVAFIVWSIVFTLQRARHACYVIVDEGGVRMTTRLGTKTYVPFTEITYAAFGRFMGTETLHLDTAKGKQAIPLAEAHAPDVEAAIQSGASKAQAYAAESNANAGVLGVLARNRQPLDVWLHRIRDMSAADYRERPLDVDELIRGVEDPFLDPEIRAGAAHALIWLRDEERAPRVMSVLGRNTPPLLTVVTTLATKLGTYVAEYEEALAYLAPEDRAVAKRMIDERPQLRRVDVHKDSPSSPNARIGDDSHPREAEEEVENAAVEQASGGLRGNA